MAQTQSIEVRMQAGVGSAARAARARALEVGFPERAADELALVATELATNLVKHAGEGVIRVEGAEENGRRGVRIEALDAGPGIEDVERVFGAGLSTAGTLGYGLPAVHRLMDEVDIASVPELERGTRITCTRWLRGAQRPSPRLPLSFGAAARPRPGSELNGDTFLIKRWDESALIAVMDGLGHGQFALRASRTASEYVERHYDIPIERLFAGVNRACRGTRGVVMAVARIDIREGRLTFGSVGNIEARLLDGPEKRALLVRRGVLGLNAPAPTIREHRWTPSSVLVLHSDGLSTRWSPADFPGFASLDARELARRLFLRCSKATDDVVLVVVKGGDPS